VTPGEAKLKAWLQGQGFHVLRNGWPDFLAVHDRDSSYAFAVESKENGDRVTRAQQAMHDALAGIGLHTHVLDPNDLPCTAPQPASQYTEPRFHRLTQAACDAATKTLNDGGGLYLVVTPARRPGEFSRSWSFRFSHEGEPRKIALGSLRKVDLKDARKLAARHRYGLEQGASPTKRQPRRRARKRVLAPRNGGAA
jgi:hypothetical protein